MGVAGSNGDDLADRVVLVTGAGRGLGRTYAEALAGAGARVAVTARTPGEPAETVAAIERAGGRLLDPDGCDGPGTVRTPMNERLLVTHAEVLEAWAPWFVALFAEGREESHRPAAELVVALAAGRADRLSGRFLSVHDDLDDLLGRAGEIDERDLLSLRLRTGADGGR